MRRRLALLACAGALAGCGGEVESLRGGAPAGRATADAPPRADCPTSPIVESIAPGVRAEQLRADHWTQRFTPREATRVLLSPRSIRELNHHASTIPGAHRDVTDEAIGDAATVATQLADRQAWLSGRVADGEYVEGEPGALARAKELIADAEAIDELRLVVEETQLYCIPLDSGLYTTPRDPAFDRNLCASLHPGELLRVLRAAAPADSHAGWLYVHAGHSVGWIRGARLTPPLSRAEVDRFRDDQPRLTVVGDDAPADFARLRFGTSFPIVGREASGGYSILVPTTTGLAPRHIAAHPDLVPGLLPFTRAQVFAVALKAVDDPYGWGGHQGGRDCSSFLYDLFAGFGILLARHSGVQAKLGSESIDVSSLDEASKRARIRAAATEGVVLLYMPGHIMLYLGHEDERDFVVSSLSEYLVPCPGGGDTVHRLDRVTVTDLELGRGSTRRSFLERITTIVIFADPS